MTDRQGFLLCSAVIAIVGAVLPAGFMDGWFRIVSAIGAALCVVGYFVSPSDAPAGGSAARRSAAADVIELRKPPREFEG